jgi:hypothetical protein
MSLDGFKLAKLLDKPNRTKEAADTKSTASKKLKMYVRALLLPGTTVWNEYGL